MSQNCCLPVDWGANGRMYAARRKDFSLRTIPLSRDLVPRVTVAPRIVVDGFFSIRLHVFFTRAAAVEARYASDDMLTLW